MKRVVYVLGAGFSAPLGIPTIGQFLQKAKDLLQERPSEFGYFKDIFRTIQTLQVANNFYSTNTDNIEDLLTLLDFRNAISDKTDPTKVNDETQVKKFISGVITASMKPLQVDKASQRWDSLLFWDRPWTDYGPFVSALLGYEFVRSENSSGQAQKQINYKCSLVAEPTVAYSVISLNYDRVLEEAEKSINYLHNQKRHFVPTSSDKRGTPLVKLHGSIGTGDIVPPLWNKSLPSGICAGWREALELLKDANDIRILGYSLPETDSYIRYLFRAAAGESTNLKRIDIICKDDGEVQERYNKFITFKGYRRGDKVSFLDGLTEMYLLASASRTDQWPARISPQELLEDNHQATFR